jgi:hypothetical protein
VSAVHVHLLLSHAPSVIILLGCGLAVCGAWLKSDDLKRAALGIFLLGALVVVLLYFTGEPSEDAVKALPGISDRIVDQHQAVAAVALASGVLIGILAGAGLFIYRQGKALAAWFTLTVVAISLVAVGLLSWTANLGGQIRHTEIRSGAAP